MSMILLPLPMFICCLLFPLIFTYTQGYADVFSPYTVPASFRHGVIRLIPITVQGNNMTLSCAQRLHQYLGHQTTRYAVIPKLLGRRVKERYKRKRDYEVHLARRSQMTASSHQQHVFHLPRSHDRVVAVGCFQAAANHSDQSGHANHASLRLDTCLPAPPVQSTPYTPLLTSATG